MPLLIEKFPAFFAYWPQKHCGSSYFFVQNIVIPVHMHSSAQKGSSFIINLQGHLVLNSAETTHQLSSCLRWFNRETCYCIKMHRWNCSPILLSILMKKKLFCQEESHPRGPQSPQGDYHLGAQARWMAGFPYAGLREHLASSHLGTVTATVPDPCRPHTDTVNRAELVRMQKTLTFSSSHMPVVLTHEVCMEVLPY